MFLYKCYAKLTLTALTLILISFAVITVPSDAKIDEATIVGMWTFEEGKGNTVGDSSQNDSEGVFVGDLKWVKGKFGGGLEFNGDTWVKIGEQGNADSLAALDFKAAEGFSIHAWVYSEVAPGGKCVIWKGLGCSTWSQWLLGTGAHENGDNSARAAFHIRAGNGGARNEALGAELPAKEWIHLVGVWDGENVYVYVNGKLSGEAPAAGPPWASGEEVYMGADPGCNKRCLWDGIMDEIVIFNVVLAEAEIKSLGNGIEGALAVDAGGKATTTWGKLKAVK